VQYYLIHEGDQLRYIATWYGTSVPDLAQLNQLSNPDLIYAGDVLCIRPAGSGFYYKVRWGDTLSEIGAAYGWSADYLAQVNHLTNPDLIFAGQLIFIPNH